MSTSKTYSNSITLVKVADGVSASSFFIDTNQDEIFRFETSAGIELSPLYVWFKIYDHSEGAENLTPLTSFKWSLSYLSGNTYKNIASNKDGAVTAYQEFFTHSPDFNSNISAQEEDWDILYFHIVPFYNSLVAKGESASELEKEIIKAIDETNSLVLKFSYIDNTGYTRSEKILTVKNGVSADMAQLNIGAAGIVASMRDASLIFNENGLSLKNGDFIIYKDGYYLIKDNVVETKDKEKQENKKYYIYDEETGYQEVTGDFVLGTTYYEKNPEFPDIYYILDNNHEYIEASNFEPNTQYFSYIDKDSVFYMEGDTGDLTLKGNVYANNGYFKGEINATSGTFNGEVNAASGKIGGFFIDKEKLYSEKTGEDEKSLIVLDGTHGLIEAENIKLGVGAEVSDYIKFATDDTAYAYIYNPRKAQDYGQSKNLWLLSNQVRLYADGRLTLGGIELNGGTDNDDAYLQSPQLYTNGLKAQGRWRINENGSAYFDTIDVNHANIQESVLKIGTIQSVGSLMLFKDSWNIKKINQLDRRIVELDGLTNLQPGDWLYDGQQVYQVVMLQQKDYYEMVENTAVYVGIFDQFVETNDTDSASLTTDGMDNDAIFAIVEDDGNYADSSHYILVSADFALTEDITKKTDVTYYEKVNIYTPTKDLAFQPEKKYYVVAYVGYIPTRDITPSKDKKYFYVTFTYEESTDVSPEPGKIYYVQTDGVYIQKEIVDGKFEDGVIYYEQKNIWESFEGSSFEEGITYYEDKSYYVETTDSEMNGSTVYYEVLRTCYQETLDEEFVFNSVVLDRDYFSNNNRYILTKFGRSTPEGYVQALETKPLDGVQYYYYDEEENLIEFEGTEFIQGVVYYRKGMGYNESSDFIISILGESADDGAMNARPFAVGNSLTVSDFYIEKGTTNPNGGTFRKRLILGDLNNSGVKQIENIRGIGLFADNVFLNGALVTRDVAWGYAGINTTNKIPFNKFEANISSPLAPDNSPIIFWGGAKENNGKPDIQNAPFQVTANGTLYATQAIIKDSIVAGANIYGSKIYTAELHGWNVDGNQAGALSIYDSSKGIIFKNNESSLFTINGSGFYHGDYEKSAISFIKLDNNRATFTGDFQTDSSLHIGITGTQIAFKNGKGDVNSFISGGINNDNSNILSVDIGFDIKNPTLQILSDEIQAKKNLKVYETLNMGPDVMVYQKVLADDKTILGYDLYVY